MRVSVQPEYFAHLGIANCYAAVNDFENAIDWYLKSITLAPAKAKNIYPIVSILYAELNQCETAENYLNKAAELLSEEEKAKEPLNRAQDIIYKCYLHSGREYFQEKLRQLGK
jgi:tetratricopeptide (TPR) repeat protein